MSAMSQLNLQDRKLNVIEQLIILNDDNVFEKVEEIINASLRRPKVNQFSKQDLKNRAKEANLDIQNGDVYSQEEVEEMSKNWR